MADETKQTEITISDPNVLSTAERELLLAYNASTAQAKIEIHDLNVKLELAQKRREQAEAFFGAALNAMGVSRGLQPPIQLSPDFTRIEGAKTA